MVAALSFVISIFTQRKGHKYVEEETMHMNIGSLRLLFGHALTGALGQTFCVGIMVLWCYGVMVLWCDGVMVL